MFVAMHKSVHLLLLAKVAQISGYCIWVDADSRGRYKILDQDPAAEIKLVPVEFVRTKCSQAMYHFKLHGEIKDKLQASRRASSGPRTQLVVNGKILK
jgi:hypothetical protein